ncbi:hypothetical protein DSO57_1001208 [Entomophthora muscae]|uniref:Uncharacterized protein n=1 Tax=Entomophthora muscae TaxID=34485 RepID=A0ACC2TWV3_9FUNG|nr:hypothetical protein DSO57_1001208 [Entomophthora muscae]
MKPFLVALGTVAATLSPTLVPVAGAMRALDPTRTLMYTRYAAAAYCKGALVENFECKSCTGLTGRFITSFGNSLLDTSGYVAVDETDKRIILVFRGTSGLINKLTDVTAIPVPILGGPLGSLVHSGFKVAIKSMASSFLPVIKTLLVSPPYADYRVAVVGHSMGGAIASLATVKLNHSLGLD